MLETNYNRPTVVIMAAGKSTRWHGSSPKQLMPINGEPLLFRTVRLLRSRGIEPVVTCRQLGQWPLFNQYVSLPNECELDRFFGAVQFVPCTFLYGDCYYTESSVDAILSDLNPWQFFGRYHSSKVKPHGEIFGVKMDDWLSGKCRELRKECVAKRRAARCIGWSLYNHVVGRRDPFRGGASRNHFTVINDDTEDIDTVDEYRILSGRIRRDN